MSRLHADIARVLAEHEAAIRRMCWLDRPGDTFTPTARLIFTRDSTGRVVTERRFDCA